VTIYQDIEWIEPHNAVCLSLLEGVAPAEAVAGLCTNDTIALSGPDEAFEWPARTQRLDSIWVAAGEIDGRTFVWESNGFGGTFPERATALSRRGRFASAYWNVNAYMTFTFATDGKMVTQFDMNWPPETEIAGLLGDAGVTLADDDVWETRPRATGLLMQAQLLGVSTPADPSWLTLPGVAFWGTSFLPARTTRSLGRS
jgi:hypothetical protein